MPVNPDDIDLIAARQVQVYKEAELQILGIVRDHLARGIDQPTWTHDRLTALGSLRRATLRVLAKLRADRGGQFRAAIAEAYRSGRGSILTDLGDVIGAEARAATKNVPRLDAIESLSAALVRDVGQRELNVLRHVQDVYREVQAAAVARSIAGGITRREASQAAWQGLVDEGVTSFTDRAGRTWRLTTYVEMAVRTVTMRAAVQGQLDRLAELGIDLVIVSNEAGECPRCRPWEGKVLSLSGPPGPRVLFGESLTEGQELGPTMTAVQATRSNEGATTRVEIAGSLAEARLAGLLHPNCRHTIRAYLPGATRLPAGPTEQPQEHKARVRQREIERKIRGNKEQAEAALTPEAKKTAEAKVRAWQAEMRQHLKDNPSLKRLPYREEIGGGNLPPGGKAPSPAGRLPGPPPTPTAPSGRHDGLDEMQDHRLRNLAGEYEIANRHALSRAELLRMLRDQGARSPAVVHAEAEAERLATAARQQAEAEQAREAERQLTHGRPIPPGKGILPNRDAPNIGDLMRNPPRDATHPEIRALAEQTRDEIKSAVDGTYGGLHVEVHHVTDPQARQLSISGSIYNPDTGEQVGTFTRTFWRDQDDILYADHRFLQLEPSAQGSGFAAEFNRNLIDWYRRSGFDRVEVHADIDVGGYTWPTQGFDFAESDVVEEFTEWAGRKLDQMTGTPITSAWGGELAAWTQSDLLARFPGLTAEEIAEQFAAMRELIAEADTRWVSAYEFTQLGRKPGQGRKDMWIGKLLMLGSDYHAVLKL